MHVVVMGCGRVGALLAYKLERRGHTVSVIDVNPEAFRRLGVDFSGRKVTGVGFDRDVLVQAGIERAGAFAAVSSGDNSNIIAARVAREMFAIEHVVARIYDPARADVYQRLGIPTVGTVKWTADQFLRRLIPEGAETVWRDPSGAIALLEVHVNPAWIGRTIAVLEDATSARIAFITRLGQGIIPSADEVLQDGDLVHVTASVDEIAAVEAAFNKAPEV